MKLWIYTVLTMILLAGCVPVEMATPEASQAVSPAVPSPEVTLPLEEPTATIPLPAEGTVAPGAVEAVEAAKEFLVIQLGVDEEEIQVVQATAVEWPDACLGIPATDEMCAQVITPGFVITLEATRGWRGGVLRLSHGREREGAAGAAGSAGEGAAGTG